VITVTYSSIDRFRKKRSFKTLKGARVFAQNWVGKNPEIGSTYAVSGDGVGKITVAGAKLADLFGDGADERDPDAEYEAWENAQAAEEARWVNAEAEKIAALERPYRAFGCTCSDQQLNLVGCNCNPEIPF